MQIRGGKARGLTLHLDRHSFWTGAVLSALALLAIVLLWLDVPARLRGRAARR